MSTVRNRESLAVLHIDIDGDWLAAEMHELLDACISFYYVQALSSEFVAPFYGWEEHPSVSRPLEYFRRQIKHVDHDRIFPLQVREVFFGSPGSWSLVGVLAGLKPLYDVFVGVLDRSTETQLKNALLEKTKAETKKTKLEIEMMALDVEQKKRMDRFELFQRLVEPGRYSDAAFREYFVEIDEKIVFLGKLAEDKKLVAVRLVED